MEKYNNSETYMSNKASILVNTYKKILKYVKTIK